MIFFAPMFFFFELELNFRDEVLFMYLSLRWVHIQLCKIGFFNFGVFWQSLVTGIVSSCKVIIRWSALWRFRILIKIQLKFRLMISMLISLMIYDKNITWNYLQISFATFCYQWIFDQICQCIGIGPPSQYTKFYAISMLFLSFLSS